MSACTLSSSLPALVKAVEAPLEDLHSSEEWSPLQALRNLNYRHGTFKPAFAHVTGPTLPFFLALNPLLPFPNHQVVPPLT